MSHPQFPLPLIVPFTSVKVEKCCTKTSQKLHFVKGASFLIYIKRNSLVIAVKGVSPLQ
jgi:hypothetical protein